MLIAAALKESLFIDSQQEVLLLLNSNMGKYYIVDLQKQALLMEFEQTVVLDKNGNNVNAKKE